MLKKLILLCLFNFPLIALAQNNVCQVRPVVNIKATELPINYNLDLFSNQLEATHLDSYNSYSLGLFRKNFTLKHNINIRSFIEGKTNNKCEYINQIYLEVNFIPRIDVAKEAQQYQCTYQRVLNHEYQHYKNFHQAAVSVTSRLNELANKHFANLPTSYNGQINLPQVMKERSQAFNREIVNLVEASTMPYDSQMDTAENYKREAMSCSQNENNSLHQLLKSRPR